MKIRSIQDSKIWVLLINETSLCRLSIVRKTIHKLVWPNSMIIIMQEGSVCRTWL